MSTISNNKPDSSNSGDKSASEEVKKLKKIQKQIKLKKFPEQFLKNQEMRLTQTRIRMMLEFPFFGSLLLNLLPKFTFDIPTMATDGIQLYVNPIFMDSLFVSDGFHSKNIEKIIRNNSTNEEAVANDVYKYLEEHAKSRIEREDFFLAEGFHINNFIIYHEVEHCIRDHCGVGLASRQGTRNLKIKDENGGLICLWNIAGDYAINNSINDDIRALTKTTASGKQVSSFIKRPKFGLFDEKFNGMTTEQIYDKLLEELKNKGKGKQDGDAQLFDLGISDGDLFDSHADALPNVKRDGSVVNEKGEIVSKEDLKARWEENFGSAYYQAKEQGLVPNGMQRTFDEMFTPPQVPWYDELSNYVFTMPNGDDINLRRPNKRFQDFFIPTHRSETINVIFAFDTSGSMFDEALMKGASEVEGIFQSFDNVKMYILACDAQIHSAELWDGATSLSEDVEKMAKAFKGGGGTDFIPVFEWIRDMDEQTADNSFNILIYFTDGYGSFPQDPNLIDIVDTIWIRRENDLKPEDFPFGKVITLN